MLRELQDTIPLDEGSDNDIEAALRSEDHPPVTNGELQVRRPQKFRPLDLKQGLIARMRQAWIWYDWASSVYVHTAISGFLPLLIQILAYDFSPTCS